MSAQRGQIGIVSPGTISTAQTPSRNDCFALALARQENCPLLTGDRELVRAAENENVPANGTIWLVEQMIHEKVITIEQAAAAYSRMEARARRLPWGKARKRLEAMASRGE